MRLKQLLKRMILSFFVILSGTVISVFVVLLVLDTLSDEITNVITADELGYMLAIAVLTNLTQLFLYSKNDLSRRQLFFRYSIIAIAVVTIVMSIAVFFAEWIDIFTQPLWLTIFSILMIFIVVMVVLMVGSKQTILENYATTDYLTKTYNRRHFISTATQVLDACVKNNRNFALITIDIDHFKKVNDTYGHSVGDKVLEIFASRVKHVVKKGSIVGRLGGEEFVVIVTNETKENTENVAWWIQRNLRERPFTIGDLEIDITASFGIASRGSGKDLAEIIRNSDRAMYKAKASGRNTVVYYDSDIEE